MRRLWGLGTAGKIGGVVCSLLGAQLAWAAEVTSQADVAVVPTAQAERTAEANRAAEKAPLVATTETKPAVVEASLEGGESDAVIIARLRSVEPERRSPAQWLRLARALVRQGQLVAAVEAYGWLPQSAMPREVEQERVRVASLVPQLQVRVDGLHPNARVFLDTQALHAEQVGQEQQVDPGWHVVLLEEHGRVTDARRVFLGAGARDLAVLTASEAWPELTNARSVPTRVERDPLPFTSLPDVQADAQGSSWLPTYLSLSVSAAAGITAGVFFIRGWTAQERQHVPCSPGPSFDVYAGCRSGPPPPSAQDRADRDMSIAGLSALVSLLGAGSALTLWALHEDAEQPQAQVSVGLGEVAVSGRF